MRKSYIYDTFLSNPNMISHSYTYPTIQMYSLIGMSINNMSINNTSYGLSINLTRNERH